MLHDLINKYIVYAFYHHFIQFLCYKFPKGNYSKAQPPPLFYNGIKLDLRTSNFRKYRNIWQMHTYLDVETRATRGKDLRIYLPKKILAALLQSYHVFQHLIDAFCNSSHLAIRAIVRELKV